MAQRQLFGRHLVFGVYVSALLHEALDHSWLLSADGGVQRSKPLRQGQSTVG